MNPDLLDLSFGQQSEDARGVGLVHSRGVCEAQLALLRHLRQNVAFISVVTLDLSRAGQLETLLRTRVCFHLGHTKACLRRAKINLS